MIYVIIPAGGRGSRYSKTTNKLNETIHKQSVLEHSLDPFLKTDQITGIIIAYPKDQLKHYEPIQKTHQKKVQLTIGGNTRAESVFNGFTALPSNCTQVLIHDAARPNPSLALIQAVISALQDHPVVIPGLPLTDTIKMVSNNHIQKTISRDSLVAVQTPQGFNANTLKKAYQNTTNIESFTDESALLEANGVYGVIVPGEKRNIKITHQHDLELMTHYLSNEDHYTPRNTPHMD